MFFFSPLLRNDTGVMGSARWHPLHATDVTVQKLQMLLFVITKGVALCRGGQSRLRGEAVTHGRRKESVDDGLATGQDDAMAQGKCISMSSSQLLAGQGKTRQQVLCPCPPWRTHSSAFKQPKSPSVAGTGVLTQGSHWISP